MTTSSSVAEKARAKYGIHPVQTVELGLLGVHPSNRGALGVSSFHAHRVAHSVATDGLSRNRYRDVTAVKVPPAAMEAFKAFNEALCGGDPKLPAFDAGMRIACLTKNHLVTALKLFKIASVPMHETGQIIMPDPKDTLLQEHLVSGVAVQLMNEALWDDEASLKAIIAEDNLNASVEMATSEVELLAFMSEELQTEEFKKMEPKLRFQRLAAKAQGRFGEQSFRHQDLLNMHNFAVRVPRPLVKNLCEVHFAHIPASFLRCKTSDYNAVAGLDAKTPHCKLALILSLYFGAGGEGQQTRGAVSGVAKLCPSMKKEVLEQLTDNSNILQTGEKF